jgi:nucleoid-associated protein YgaU
MASAASVGETRIPLHSPHAPAQADRAALLASLYRLIWLATWLTLMRLLGYRLTRHRVKSVAPSPTPGPAARLASPRRKHRKHRTIDRQRCIAMLAGINTQFAAQAPADPSPLARRPVSRPAHRAPAEPRQPSIAVPAAPPCQPASGKKPATPTNPKQPISFRHRNKPLVRPAPAQVPRPVQRRRTR